MEKTTIYYESKGESGNIFYILGMTREALRKQRRINDFNECWERVQKCKSYNEALNVIGEYVDLVDLSDK